MTHWKLAYIGATHHTLLYKIKIFPGKGKGRSNMATKIVNKNRSIQEDCLAQQSDEHVDCSVGIMAYNEEANIGRTIYAVLEQQGPSVSIVEVIVVASGCTDRT